MAIVLFVFFIFISIYTWITGYINNDLMFLFQ